MAAVAAVFVALLSVCGRITADMRAPGMPGGPPGSGGGTMEYGAPPEHSTEIRAIEPPGLAALMGTSQLLPAPASPDEQQSGYGSVPGSGGMPMGAAPEERIPMAASPPGAAVAAVEEAFPGVVADGAVSRPELGKRVFGDAAALRRAGRAV